MGNGGQRNMKSILTQELDRCMTCGCYGWIEHHHIFGGSNRKKSTKYKLIAPLCHYCHNEPPNGAHHNKINNDKLKQKGQRVFEDHHPELDFRKLFGKNYL